MLSKLHYKWQKGITLLGHTVNLVYNRLFNSTVRQQLKDPKIIPVVIISFNQLNYLKKLVDGLLQYGYKTIVILDNNSTFPPLLEYFKTLDSKVTLHKLDKNLGHLAFWQSPNIFRKYGRGYYIVTDPDVVPIESCPEDFVSTLRRLLDKAYDRTKVGLSLKLDDIPDSNPNKKAIMKWEARFNEVTSHPLAFKAEVDTTFAIYRPGYTYKLKNFTKAWRTKAPLQARHGGWYLDINRLTEEQRFYMQTANQSASWQMNEKGELVNTIHKSLYNE